jgi:hypothetical protein
MQKKKRAVTSGISLNRLPSCSRLSDGGGKDHAAEFLLGSLMTGGVDDLRAAKTMGAVGGAIELRLDKLAPELLLDSRNGLIWIHEMNSRKGFKKWIEMDSGNGFNNLI